MALIYAQIVQDKTKPKIDNGGIEGVKPLGRGKYQVTFKAGTFTSPPAVAATVISSKRECESDGTSRFISVTNLTESEVCFAINSVGGVSLDRDFNLVAVGV